MKTEQQETAMKYFSDAYERQMNGDFDGAIMLYTKSLEILPTAEAHTFLAWTYSFEGKLDRAIEECLKAIEVDPSFGNPYNDIGAYLIEQGKLDEAIPWLEKAIEAPRYDARCYPYLNLGRIYEQKMQWLKAIGYYEHALAQNPEYELAAQSMQRLIALRN